MSFDKGWSSHLATRMPKMLFTHSMVNPSWALSRFICLPSSIHELIPLKSIVVEFAKESRPRREVHEDRGYGYGG